jgi:hypothetical protein
VNNPLLIKRLQRRKKTGARRARALFSMSPAISGATVHIAEGAVIGPFRSWATGAFIGGKQSQAYGGGREHRIGEGCENGEPLFRGLRAEKRGAGWGLYGGGSGRGLPGGAGASVLPGVKIWPGKSIGEGEVVHDNHIWAPRGMPDRRGQDGRKLQGGDDARRDGQLGGALKALAGASP